MILILFSSSLFAFSSSSTSVRTAFNSIFRYSTSFCSGDLAVFFRVAFLLLPWGGGPAWDCEKTGAYAFREEHTNSSRWDTLGTEDESEKVSDVELNADLASLTNGAVLGEEET